MRDLAIVTGILLAGCAAHAPTGAVTKLPGTSWRLVGSEPPATISFQEDGRVAGSGSCNRFFGSAKIEGDALTLGPLGATKMACPEPIMAQEKRFLEALGNATRYAVDGKTLSIWVKGSERPLTFTRDNP
jgi:heat shock protein HslJ